MSNHTPGPWGVREGFRAEEIEIFPIDENVKPPFYMSEICCVKWIDDQEANARLIAAAPDLLEALKDCLGWHDFSNDGHKPIEIRAAYRRARAAIAKATGDNHE